MEQMLPSYIKTILTILHHAQAEAFLVGGCVRDMILKRPIHDYDITTNLSPSQVQLLFQEKGYTVLSTGIAYGTVSILIHRQIIEITTYRMETSYQNHRFPSQFHYTKNIEEDLKRRDFTMNAIAYHPQIGYVDPYQGYEDIQKACIRCVGNPHQRFQEDALRILRALRFSCTLSFSIEKDTAIAIQKNAHLLTHISQERIRNEFTKMLQSNFENLFLFLKEFNVLYYILPFIKNLYPSYEQFESPSHAICIKIDKLLHYAIQESYTLKLALLFYIYCPLDPSSKQISIDNIAKEYMKTMKYDNKTIQEVCYLLSFGTSNYSPQKNSLRYLLYQLDFQNELALQVLHMRKCILYYHQLDTTSIDQCILILQEIISTKDYITKQELNINGHDLIQLGYQGKQIGVLLQYAYEQVLQDPSLNTKEHLFKIIQQASL